jgi:hypothetical protein
VKNPQKGNAWFGMAHKNPPIEIESRYGALGGKKCTLLCKKECAKDHSQKRVKISLLQC